MGIMLSSIGDGRKWVCKHGAVVDSDSSTAVPPCLEPPKSEQWDGPFESHTLVSFEALDLEEESASENATRSIFGWLRFEGYPPAERDIHEHPWVKIEDSLSTEASSETPRLGSSSFFLNEWTTLLVGMLSGSVVKSGGYLCKNP